MPLARVSHIFVTSLSCMIHETEGELHGKL